MIASADLQEAVATPQGARMGDGAVGVIDLGSNSVRLVLYERASRAPTVLFNEKVLAGLGEGLAQTGALPDAAQARALDAVARFMAIARAAGVRDVSIVATAAARVASNGADFIRRIEEVAGAAVRVLDGREEAQMAASGVLCGFWRPDGVVGDLGGGSLELIDVGEHGLGPGDSFSLGTLRLRGEAKGALSKATELIESALEGSVQLPLMAGRTLYAVGGTWRSLFRLHMAETRYPISVMHHYRVAAPDMAAFCDRILKNSLDSMARASVVSKGRRPLVPWGAAVMRSLVALGRPKEVVASALGVREGLILCRPRNRAAADARPSRPPPPRKLAPARPLAPPCGGARRLDEKPPRHPSHRRDGERRAFASPPASCPTSAGAPTRTTAATRAIAIRPNAASTASPPGRGSASRPSSTTATAASQIPPRAPPGPDQALPASASRERRRRLLPGASALAYVIAPGSAGLLRARGS